MCGRFVIGLLAVICVMAACSLPVNAQRPARGGNGSEGPWGQGQDQGFPPGGGRRGDDRGNRGDEGEFDPAAFLRRLDANGNGLLEQSEMSNRTRRMLERMGMDPANDHPLEKIIEQFREQRGGREQIPEPTQPVSRQIERKVPGFGVEAPPPKLPPGFGADVAMVGGSPSSMSQYSSAVQEMVQQALARYDANDNGIIDGEEFQRVRWSSPSATEADLNKDGTLTVNEIAERFLARERVANQIERNGGGRNNERNSERNNDSAQRGESNRGGGRGSDSSEATRGPNEDTSENDDRRGGGDEIHRYRSYVEGMMKRYDTNGDGYLDKEELKKMTRPPSDFDGDGIVTLDEYIDFVGSGDSPAPSSSNAATAESRPSSARSDNASEERGASRFGRNRPSSAAAGSPNDSGRGASQTQFSYFERDANGDGQIQMYEFAQVWSDDVLRQFRQFDLNGDGVITFAEYETTRKSR